MCTLTLVEENIESISNVHIKETQTRSQIHLKELTTLASICVHLYHTKYKPMELGKNVIE
jgi:hypothetical protein